MAGDLLAPGSASPWRNLDRRWRGHGHRGLEHVVRHPAERQHPALALDHPHAGIRDRSDGAVIGREERNLGALAANDEPDGAAAIADEDAIWQEGLG